jgi:hypothetical protein
MQGIHNVYTVYCHSDLCIKISLRNESQKYVCTHTALLSYINIDLTIIQLEHNK